MQAIDPDRDQVTYSFLEDDTGDEVSQTQRFQIDRDTGIFYFIKMFGMKIFF